MPIQVEQKTVDPEAELSNVQRMVPKDPDIKDKWISATGKRNWFPTNYIRICSAHFTDEQFNSSTKRRTLIKTAVPTVDIWRLITFEKLEPMCSIKKRARGVPQLATQEKQINILKNEMKETLLCIKLATKGQHAIRDHTVKEDMKKSIVDYETLDSDLKHEKSQVSELNILNYLAKKLISDLSKSVPAEADEMALLESAHNRLRRMENSLDQATKRFCLVNATNSQIRDEIHRLLIERNSFNVQWNRTIGRLLRGKEYLMDILEIATVAFSERDECCKRLETLKWRGLFHLNRDISEMQTLESDLNHLSKLEEFLRTKGSIRICEADEKEDIKREEEIARCEQEIAAYDKLIDDVFHYAGNHRVSAIVRNFKMTEMENFSIFTLLCEVLQQSVHLRTELENTRQIILDQRDINEARAEKQEKRITEITATLLDQQQNTINKLYQDRAGEDTFIRVLAGIQELVELSKCDVTPLLSLLGNNREVTQFNADKFLKILECEIKSLVEVAYGAVKPPPPMPVRRSSMFHAKLVADPNVPVIRPNRIDKLVTYQPCAYCVEDYIMNQVFETPAVIADKKYIESILHLEDNNTRFGIFTLTILGKRHPVRGQNE